MEGKEYKYMRFNAMVTPFVKETVSARCRESGTTISEYVCRLAENIEIPDSKILKLRVDRYEREYRLYARKYVREFKNQSEEESGSMNGKNGASTKTAQFHLRVSPTVYAKIKERADKMSMSVSDYVMFVTARYDIEEITLKLQKMSKQFEDYNELLKKYNELQEKYNKLLEGKKEDV